MECKIEDLKHFYHNDHHSDAVTLYLKAHQYTKQSKVTSNTKAKFTKQGNVKIKTSFDNMLIINEGLELLEEKLNVPSCDPDHEPPVENVELLNKVKQLQCELKQVWGR